MNELINEHLCSAMFHCGILYKHLRNTLTYLLMCHMRNLNTCGNVSKIYRVAQKKSGTLCNYNGAYILWGKISFGTSVDQYVLLLSYKFKRRH